MPERLHTWDELRDHVRQTFSATQDDSGAVVIATPTEVVLRPLAVDREAWVELIATIGPAHEADPAYALAHSFDLAVGALWIERGMVGLRQLLPLDGLAAADLDDAVRALIASAQRSAG